MKSLAIVVCGQIRNFFNDRVQSSFHMLVTRCMTKYDVHVYFVVSDPECPTELFALCPFTVLHYAPVAAEYHASAAADLSGPFVRAICDMVSFRPDIADKESHKGILNAHSHQFCQMMMALTALEEHERERGSAYDYVMRTRFDMVYPDDLLPYEHMSYGFVGHAFPHSAAQQKVYADFCVANRLDPMMYHMAQFPKPVDTLRVDSKYYRLNLGGAYYYRPSFNSLDKTPRVYCWNDYVWIGPRVCFRDFHTIFKNMERPEYFFEIMRRKITFPNAHEAQLLLFFFSRGFDCVMYLDDTCTVVR
jgi:hypothetical protein